MAGPKTRAALEEGPEPEPIPDDLPELAVDAEGWLEGEGVERIPSDPSWFYPELATDDGRPTAIIAHYTATAPGTGENLARHRARERTAHDCEQGFGSWHVTVETDGRIIQQAPLLVGC